MNTNTNSYHVSTTSPYSGVFWKSFGWLFSLRGFLLLITGCGLLSGLFLTQQYRGAQRAWDREIAAIRQSGEPTSQAELKNYLQQSAPAHWTKELSQVVSNAGIYTKLSNPGITNLPESFADPYISIFRGQAWEAEPLFRENLEIYRPLLQQMSELIDSQPSSHVGTVELFDNPNFYKSMTQLIQIVAWEARHALYHQELERFQRGMDCLFFLVESNSHFALYGHTFYLQAGAQYLNLVGDLLSYDLLSPQELEDYRKRIAALPQFSQAYREMMIAQRALWIADLNSGALSYQQQPQNVEDGWARFYQSLPWIKLETLRTYHALFETALKNPPQFVAEQKNVPSQKTQSHFLQQIRNSLIALEDRRNLVLTALSIKIYQLKNQRWPTNLGELNLSPSQTRSILGSEFFFQIEPFAQTQTAPNSESETPAETRAFLWTITGVNPVVNQLSLDKTDKENILQLMDGNRNRVLIRID